MDHDYLASLVIKHKSAPLSFPHTPNDPGPPPPSNEKNLRATRDARCVASFTRDNVCNVHRVLSDLEDWDERAHQQQKGKRSIASSPPRGVMFPLLLIRSKCVWFKITIVNSIPVLPVAVGISVTGTVSRGRVVNSPRN